MHGPTGRRWSQFLSPQGKHESIYSINPPHTMIRSWYILVLHCGSLHDRCVNHCTICSSPPPLYRQLCANYSTHCRFTGCLLCNDLRLTDTPVSPIYSMRGHDLHSLGVTCIKEMPHKNAATVPLPTSDKLSAGTSGHLLVTVCARQTGGLTSRPGV